MGRSWALCCNRSCDSVPNIVSDLPRCTTLGRLRQFILFCLGFCSTFCASPPCRHGPLDRLLFEQSRVFITRLWVVSHIVLLRSPPCEASARRYVALLEMECV